MKKVATIGASVGFPKRLRSPLQQTFHVVYEITYFLLSLFSRTINAVFFKGSMHQTLSSRAHIEAHSNPEWATIEKRINFVWELFTLGTCKNHCEDAWEFEVSRAYKTLDRNKIRGEDKTR